MYIKDLKHCDEFLAGDSTILRELLHPDAAFRHPVPRDKSELSLRYSLPHALLKPGTA